MSAESFEAPRLYRWLRTVSRIALRTFFRSVEISGLENIPPAGKSGGLMVAWHPNGVIDGMLLFAFLPRRLVVGARHGLFEIPVMGWFLRQIGAVPLYRRSDAPPGLDEDERRAANAKSLGRMIDEVTSGAFCALFPEGRTHDEPGLADLKTGAARLYYDIRRATARGVPEAAIVPVGLHYDRKHLFGSRVLLAFHPPMILDPALATPVDAEAPFEQKRQQAKDLTLEIGRTLQSVILPAESWELHHHLHRVRKIMRAERALEAGSQLRTANMEERTLGYRRVWEAYEHRKKTHPEEVAAMMVRVSEYNESMRALQLRDRDLDHGPNLGLTRVFVRILLQFVLIVLVLPPFLVFGLAVNLPIALLVRQLGKLGNRKYKGQASVTVVTGVFLFPLAWLSVSGLVAFGMLRFGFLLPRLPENAPWIAAIVTFAFCLLGGAFALEYLRLSSATIRAIRVRLTRARRRAILEMLREERSAIYQMAQGLAAGLDLSGRVRADGRIGPDES